MNTAAYAKYYSLKVCCYYFIFTLKSSGVYAKVVNGDLLKLVEEDVVKRETVEFRQQALVEPQEVDRGNEGNNGVGYRGYEIGYEAMKVTASKGLEDAKEAMGKKYDEGAVFDRVRLLSSKKKDDYWAMFVIRLPIYHLSSGRMHVENKRQHLRKGLRKVMML
ncbi:hypothetical protein Tco_1357616 [Tanacetum coccineum]